MHGSASAEAEFARDGAIEAALARLEQAQTCLEAALAGGDPASAADADSRRHEILEALIARAAHERPGPIAVARLADLQARIHTSQAASGEALRLLSERAGRHNRALKGYRGR